MRQLIYETCLWGRHRFDGWVMARAVYRKYSNEAAVCFHTQRKKSHRYAAVLETTGYTQAAAPAGSLEVLLMDVSKDKNQQGDAPQLHFQISATSKPSSLESSSTDPPFTDPSSTDPPSMCFLKTDLRQFLKESGDTNPIHRGDPALVPGLWIFTRLYEPFSHMACSPLPVLPIEYGLHLPIEYSIRLIRPTYTGQPIYLKCENNTVTGSCDGLVHFHLQIKNL